MPKSIMTETAYRKINLAERAAFLRVRIKAMGKYQPKARRESLLKDLTSIEDQLADVMVSQLKAKGYV